MKSTEFLVGIVSAIVRAIATPGFVNAPTVATKVRTVICVTLSGRAEFFVEMRRAGRIAVAPIRWRETRWPMQIVAEKTGRTIKRTTEFVIAIGTIPPT